MKPFTDGEFIKDCMIKTGANWFPDKPDIQRAFKDIQLSARTVAQRVDIYIYIYISLLAKILQPVSPLRLLRYFCKKKTKNEPKTNRECSITYGCSGGVIRNSMVASRNYTKE